MKALLILLLMFLLVGTVYSADPLVLQYTWESGDKCTIKMDTTVTKRVVWKYNGNTFYRYPIQLHCQGKELYSLELIDAEGFTLGGHLFGTQYYQIPNNPIRIYDYAKSLAKFTNK